MSVTFFLPGVPTEVVYPYPEEPEYYETRPAAPFFALNMANSNAADMLGLIAPWADPWGGSWEGEVLHTVRKETMRVLNTNADKLLKDTTQEGNFVDCGRDIEYVTRRLTQMLELLALAIRHNRPLCYG